MTSYILPMSAAFACAICNGSAAVLQKISADKEKKTNSLDSRLLWRLFKDKPYISGVILDILGWLFTLYAVQYLPLFLVEAVIAANIVVTALVERIFRQLVIKPKSYLAIIVILLGLLSLAIAASPEKAEPISKSLKWLILLMPLPIGLVGYIMARGKSYGASIGLALMAGLAFGATSVIGRIFKASEPLWHTIYSPLVLALIVSSTLGLLLFSIALQRAQATVINASMVASQSLIPAAIGIVFLGDNARKGFWPLAGAGALLTIAGVVLLAQRHTQSKT